MQMHWTIAENLAEILRAIEIAKRDGANLCVFPELALTGFHRKIASLATPALVAPALQTIQATCKTHSVATIFGAPTFGANNAIYNSAVFIDERGNNLGAVEKNGLTAPEATFFTHGTKRPTFSMLNTSISAVLCREIHDREAVVAQLVNHSTEQAAENAFNKTDLIVWPGIMRPDPNAAETGVEKHIEDARQLARYTGAWIVQANWPNSLNYPAESEFAGQSAVINPRGEIVFRLPIAQAGVGVFSLETIAYAWYVR